MSQESERPAPAQETGPAENVAATAPLAGHSRAERGHSAPLTLALLNAALRDEGMARASEATDEWTKRCWQTGIAYCASTGLPFGADEVRELGVPEPKSPGAVGAMFMAHCRQGLIRPVGFVQSRRRSRHASWQRQWVGGPADTSPCPLGGMNGLGDGAE